MLFRSNTELGRKIAREIVLYASEKKADVIVFEYLEMKGKLSGKKSRNCRCGENVISRNGADSRHTERESEFPGFVPGTRAGLPLMDQEKLPVIYGIIVCVRFRPEKDTTVICRHRIISEQDILSVKF